MGEHYRFFHINAICISLGESKSRALPVFHSFFGCDTTSASKGKSKKSIWGAWQAFQDVTDTFLYSATHPFQLLKAESEHFKKLERLTAVLYDKTTPFSSTNQIRKELFCQKNQAMENLPPTEDAFLQHIRRAVYQAGIWTTSTQTQQVIPPPHDFAWNKVLESWVPVWMTIPEVSRPLQMWESQSGLLTTRQVQV
ncbi:hypothetical protein JTB14_032329 [Gonioctena quinquepunctata]|nr:hypothetical protein JTB14_032329 [Gonioctena quinquepunctata]